VHRYEKIFAGMTRTVRSRRRVAGVTAGVGIFRYIFRFKKGAEGDAFEGDWGNGSGLKGKDALYISRIHRKDPDNIGGKPQIEVLMDRLVWISGE
jgi:hypothetical protein